ncbi:hypothetical protein [Metallosphaera sp.]
MRARILIGFISYIQADCRQQAKGLIAMLVFSKDASIWIQIVMSRSIIA